MSTSTDKTRFVPFVEATDGIYGYINGVAVTDEVIERLNANAEAGFPGVKSRPVGRPLLLDEPLVSVSVRLPGGQVRQAHEQAASEGISFPEFMRQIVKAGMEVRGQQAA